MKATPLQDEPSQSIENSWRFLSPDCENNYRLKLTFHVVSRLFHPILIPFYGTLLYCHYLFEKIEGPFKLLTFVAGITFIAPLVLYYLLKRKGKVSSSSLPYIKERRIPLLLNTFLLSISAVVINQYPYLELRDWFVLLAIQNLSAFAMLWIRFKTSIHLFNNLSLVLFLALLPLGLSTTVSLFVAVVWIGLICAARLVLKAHRPIELLVGGVLAFSAHAVYFCCEI